MGASRPAGFVAVIALVLAAARCNLLIVVPEPKDGPSADAAPTREAAAPAQDAAFSPEDSGGRRAPDADVDGGAPSAAPDAGADRPDSGPAPITLTSGRDQAQSLAVDPINDAVYWTELAGGVYRVSKDGGVVTTIKQPDSRASAGQVATDGANVYWVDSADGTIAYASVDGGSPSVLASSPGPLGLATNGTSVYWSDSVTEAIYGTPAAGPHPSVAEALYGGPTAACCENVRAIAATPDWLVWAEKASPPNAAHNGYVYTLSLDTPGASPLDITGGNIQNVDVPAIATDGTYVYWTESSGGNIWAELTTDGPGEQEIEWDESLPGPLAVSATGDLYWVNARTSSDAGSVSAGTLRHAKRVAGVWLPGTTIARATAPVAIGIDGAAVYWINGGTPASIEKLLLTTNQ